MGPRRIGRERALQLLYGWDAGRISGDEILRSCMEIGEIPPYAHAFAVKLFRGVTARLDEIDRLIQAHAKNWRLERMAAVDRNVLRLAVFELLSGGKSPDSAIINEAIELARRFSTQDSAQFVNGILDGILKDLPEKQQENYG